MTHGALSTRSRPPVRNRAVLLGVVAAVPYLAVAGNLRCDFQPSQFPYHVYQADAFLHGQLHLRDEVMKPRFARLEPIARDYAPVRLRAIGEPVTPETVEKEIHRSLIHDLAEVGGLLYTYWPPLTPTLLLPWVAVFGPDVSDRLVNALYGAVNVGLMYWLLRRIDRAGLLPMSEGCCVALTVLLAFGTVHFWLSCDSQVWFAVQIATLMPLLLSIGLVVSPRGAPAVLAVAGAAFGAAFLGRNTVLLVGLFFPAVIWLLWRRRAGGTFGGGLVRLAAFTFPVAVAGLAQLMYNHGRFGDAFESGLAVQLHTGGDTRFRDEFDRYGPFNRAYLSRNVKHYLWNVDFPIVNGRRSYDAHGNSLFLVTPPFILMLFAWRRRSVFTAALLGGVLPLLTALLFFNGTGYSQFGNRYLLDAMPLSLLLVAAGMNGRVTFPAFVLIVAAVAMNTFGTVRVHQARLGPLADYVTPALLLVLSVLVIAFAIVPYMRARRWGECEQACPPNGHVPASGADQP